jgi:hypothetical protein
MTLDRLWPLLLVTGLGAGLVLAAVLLHRRTSEGTDAGCFVFAIGVVGLILLWQGAAAITDLAGKTP